MDGVKYSDRGLDSEGTEADIIQCISITISHPACTLPSPFVCTPSDPSSLFSAAEVSSTILVMSSFTPGLASTNAPVPMATGGAKMPSSSGGGGGGAVAGGVIAALVIVGALVLVAVLCYLYIRSELSWIILSAILGAIYLYCYIVFYFVYHFEHWY